MLAGPVMQQCRFSKSNDLTGLKKNKNLFLLIFVFQRGVILLYRTTFDSHQQVETFLMFDCFIQWI